VLDQIANQRTGLQVEGEIGEPGGQKWVYRVRDPHYDVCCLKIIQQGDPLGQARLERELLVLIETEDCPNLPTLFLTPDEPIQMGERAFPWYLEELLVGQTVSELMGQPWQEIDSLSLIRDVTVAIDAIWDLGVVHRDIKPHNIFKADRGFVLLDPGLARHQTLETLTRIWFPPGPGTPGYHSPDQFRFTSDKLDARSDIFSLGIVAFETLTGNHPFWRPETRHFYPDNMAEGPGKALEQFGNHLSDEIKKLTSVMLAPRRHERPRTPKLLLSMVDEMIRQREE
jgi:serine/threonine-protein kinase